MGYGDGCRYVRVGVILVRVIAAWSSLRSLL